MRSEVRIKNFALCRKSLLQQSLTGLICDAFPFSVGFGLQSGRGLLRLDAGLVFSGLYTAGSVSL